MTATAPTNSLQLKLRKDLDEAFKILGNLHTVLGNAKNLLESTPNKEQVLKIVTDAETFGQKIEALMEARGISLPYITEELGELKGKLNSAQYPRDYLKIAEDIKTKLSDYNDEVTLVVKSVKNHYSLMEEILNGAKQRFSDITEGLGNILTAGKDVASSVATNGFSAVREFDPKKFDEFFNKAQSKVLDSFTKVKNDVYYYKDLAENYFNAQLATVKNEQAAAAKQASSPVNPTVEELNPSGVPTTLQDKAPVDATHH